MPSPLVIIPTYNERPNLARVTAGVRKALPAAHILIVDDHSPDGTAELAAELAAQDQSIHLLERPGKQGLGSAYQAGMTWAIEQQFDPLITMDADLSHDPAALPDLLAASQAGADLVIGSRYVPGGSIHGWSWDRYLLSMGANHLAKMLLGLKPKDVTAGFKIYRRQLLEEILAHRMIATGYTFQIEMIARAQALGATIQEVPITFHDRTAGRSKVSRHELLTSFKSLLSLTRQRPVVRELTRFMLVGSLNFGVDLGVTNLLVIFGHVRSDLAGYGGTIIALINSFFLNRHWTFHHRRAGSLGHQFVRFLAVNGAGALMNALAYTLLLQFGHLNYNWAKLLAILASFAWNFFGTRALVFRHASSPSVSQD